ncbi:hypothetical protein K0U83_18665 [bacterium]|nr:hypothetical protein [bacterium]
MPSNKELITEIDALASALGLDIETDGLKNDQLAALVSDLKAKKTDAETDTAADTAPARKAGKPEYYVAPRCAITSKRGILSGDTEDEVKAEYLAGGAEALKAFVSAGKILKG